MQKKEKKPIIVPYPLSSNWGIGTDPAGSYTGVPVFPFEEPVQDADDL